MEFPKPYDTQEIDRHTKAVFISLLIGGLLLFGAAIVYLYINFKDSCAECEKEKKILIDKMINDKEERLRLYEEKIFYKEQLKKANQVADSLIMRTKPLIEKISNEERKQD